MEIQALIDSLKIFQKYGDATFYCNDETLELHGIPYDKVSPEDREALKELDWLTSASGPWLSFRFGS